MIGARVLAGLAVLAVPSLLTACDECFGTPSCHTWPEISYTGRFVQHRSGVPVAGVKITLRRESGVALSVDTLQARSDADGFFTLRAPGLQEGTAWGSLHVEPPPPYAAFSIPDVALHTSRTRGNGGDLGRLVVNPYVLLVGHVRDRRTLSAIPGATVIVRRLGGGRLEADSASFVTDAHGYFAWVEPRILEPGAVDASFEILANGYGRPYHVRRDVRPSFREGEQGFVVLPVGYGIVYELATGRRGSREPTSPTTVEFTRTGGIVTQPSMVTITADARGRARIMLDPAAEGTVTGTLRIVPPAPFPPETADVQLATTDDDRPSDLGFFGYGAQVAFRASLRDAGTGEPLPPGTVVAVRRTAGVPLDWTRAPADSGLRAVAAAGEVRFEAPTPDSGTVQFDLVVRFPAPFAWDTIGSVNIPSRYSDSVYDAGVIPVRRRTP